MADISKIRLPSGITYDLKDATARDLIQTIQGTITGAMSYVGVTTTPITDEDTTTPVIINGTSYTPAGGNVVIYGDSEYVWSDYDNAWHEFGSTGSLGALAFKDTASATYTPAGTVTQPTFIGTQETISASFIPAGTVSVGTGAANYTPSGNISVTPTVTLNSTTVNSITGVGSLPSCTLPTWDASV